MTKTISRLFDSYDSAARAVRELEAVGVPQADIGVVANNSENWYAQNGDGKLCAGLSRFEFRGVGPVLARGWFVSASAGTASGGTAQRIIGALTQSGLSDQDAQVYAEGIRRGGTLVVARVHEAHVADLDRLLGRSSLSAAELHGSYSKLGWRSFDESAPPYSADQVRKARRLRR